eukprot:350628-Chlamydomonas_euryale.AAC.9
MLLQCGEQLYHHIRCIAQSESQSRCYSERTNHGHARVKQSQEFRAQVGWHAGRHREAEATLCNAVLTPASRATTWRRVPALPDPATVANGSGAVLYPRRVARRSRAPCRRSEARDRRRKRGPSRDRRAAVAESTTRPRPRPRPGLSAPHPRPGRAAVGLSASHACAPYFGRCTTVCPLCSIGSQKPDGWSTRTQPGCSLDTHPCSCAPLRGQSAAVLEADIDGDVRQNMLHRRRQGAGEGCGWRGRRSKYGDRQLHGLRARNAPTSSR